MADQGVHPAEYGFVDDVSPGKFSNLTSIDRSIINCISFQRTF